jgi:hypothetical protein
MKTIATLFLAAAATFAADVTGTWYFAVDLSIGSGSPTLVLKQEGNKVTGTYSGTIGEAKVTGTVDGDKVELTADAEAAGEKVKIVYSGALKTPTTMEGKTTYGNLGSGTFTAKKKE